MAAWQRLRRRSIVEVRWGRSLGAPRKSAAVLYPRAFGAFGSVLRPARIVI